MNKFFKKYYLYILLVLAAAGVLFFRFESFFNLTETIHQNSGVQITSFVDKRDRPFIKRLIDEDYYWLVNYPNFDVDFMLDNNVPAKDKMQYLGKLNIKIITEDGKPAGFLTYFPENFMAAKIQFVAIDKEARNKGYAKKLLENAFAEIKAKGYRTVHLVTRSTNKPAINLYKNLGFEILETDPYGVVYFSKNL